AVKATQAQSEAVTAGKQAAEERDRAQKEWRRAEDAAQQALASAAEAQGAAAVGQLLLAQAAWRANEADLARQYLNRVPQEYRDWLWRHLKREYLGGLFALTCCTGDRQEATFSRDRYDISG